MRLYQLAIVYGAVGLVWLGITWVKRDEVNLSTTDSLLLSLLWPLYAPFWIAKWRGFDSPSPAEDHREQTLLRTLHRARGTLFESVLPDETTARHISHRLRIAEEKIREIDGLLSQPAFSESAAIARRDQLVARDASFFAIQAADKRLQSIQKLRALRARYASELEEVDELIQQLSAQTEVARVAGAQDPHVQEWISEIILRVDSLEDAMKIAVETTTGTEELSSSPPATRTPATNVPAN